jgi:hypothetical protein
MTCPHCHESARFVGYRPKNVVSLLGDLGLQRGYYHCKSCGQSQVPWDNLLRLSPQRLTPAAQEVTTLAGILESFGEAAERTLAKLAGLRLSESTVQRTTEAAGKQLGERLQQGEVFGSKQTWDWHQDASQRSCAYVSVDATGILMQGASPGSEADGRMVYVGMVFNPRPRPLEHEVLAMPCDGSRYLAGLYTLAELGLQLRRQAAHVGMETAQQWIALTDGGNGLEEFIDVNFPRAEKILDFQHVAGHVNDFAKALRSGVAADKLAEAWCHTLKHAGGVRLIEVLERLDRKKMVQDVQIMYDKLLQYLRNNVNRMKYPEYLRQGWQIATGAVESACKTVINRRLCMGGMRWGEYGADGVAHLRALYRSDPDQWDAYWACANIALAA